MTESIGTLLILGADGDLSKRLLLSGVGQVLASGRGAEFRLIGIGQKPMTDDQWRERVASLSAGSADPRSNVDELQRILATCTGAPAIYFALPPTVTIAACATLDNVELPASPSPTGSSSTCGTATTSNSIGSVTL